MSIDWNKPIYFPNNLPPNARLTDVRRDQYQILTTQRRHPSDRCVVFMSDTGILYTSTIDGQSVMIADSHKAYPVANIPETVEIDVWMNVYSSGMWTVYYSRAAADGSSSAARIACINVKRTVEVGEGLIARRVDGSSPSPQPLSLGRRPPLRQSSRFTKKDKPSKIKYINVAEGSVVRLYDKGPLYLICDKAGNLAARLSDGHLAIVDDDTLVIPANGHFVEE